VGELSRVERNLDIAASVVEFEPMTRIAWAGAPKASPSSRAHHAWIITPTERDAISGSRKPCGAALDLTKDGVSVAKEIELEDKFENMGAQMLREVASKTNDLAGRRHHHGDRPCASNREGRRQGGCLRMNPMDLKRGIDADVLHQSRR
jgi:hypothetical protein